MHEPPRHAVVPSEEILYEEQMMIRSILLGAQVMSILLDRKVGEQTRRETRLPSED